MSVKGRRIAVPPFFGSFLPSSPTSQKERLAFVLTVEQFRICLVYRQIILQGHFQLFLTCTPLPPARASLQSFKLTFLFNEIDILLLGLIYMRKTKKSSTKFKLFFYIDFLFFLSNISVQFHRSFLCKKFHLSFS